MHDKPQMIEVDALGSPPGFIAVTDEDGEVIRYERLSPEEQAFLDSLPD